MGFDLQSYAVLVFIISQVSSIQVNSVSNFKIFFLCWKLSFNLIIPRTRTQQNECSGEGRNSIFYPAHDVVLHWSGVEWMCSHFSFFILKETFSALTQIYAVWLKSKYLPFSPSSLSFWRHLLLDIYTSCAYSKWVSWLVVVERTIQSVGREESAFFKK